MDSKRKEKEMEWSTTNNVENIGGSFIPQSWLESNSSNSLHTFNYHPYAAGNSYTPANTQTGPVISVPESEKMINAYQCPSNNNEMIKNKKRLTSEQLDSLEQFFQEDMKLDSYRKAKLSEKLGLDPRQVAVWFQNRRARWKVKDLEESYDSLRHVHNNVLRENHMLHDEVKKLRSIILKYHLMMRESNLNYNQISDIDQYNNLMFVAPTCWLPRSQPPYPW